MRTPPSTVGLVLAAVLAVADVATALLTDGEHPPMVVALVAGAFGLATLAALVPAWRGSRTAAWIVVTTRLLSAVTALPAFFVDDVPAPAVVAAAVGVAATLVAVGLVLTGLRRRGAVGARG